MISGDEGKENGTPGGQRKVLSNMMLKWCCVKKAKKKLILNIKKIEEKKKAKKSIFKKAQIFINVSFMRKWHTIHTQNRMYVQKNISYNKAQTHTDMILRPLRAPKLREFSSAYGTVPTMNTLMRLRSAVW